VLNQSLKNNSSISLVNTNVWRSGKAYDANVTAVLLDMYDKKNNWNIGGNVSISNLMGKEDKNIRRIRILLAMHILSTLVK
jgi:hypothetical protein